MRISSRGELVKLTLRNKFILYFSPLVLLIFLVGGAGIWTFSSIKGNFDNLQRDVTPSALAMLELKEVLLALESGLRDRQLPPEKIAAWINRLRNLVKKHLLHETHSHEPGKQTAHDMRHRAIRIMSLAQYILNSAPRGLAETEVEELYAAIGRERNELSVILDEHLALHLQELARTEGFITEKYRRGLAIVWLVVIFTLLLSTGMVVYLLRSILQPINLLREGARQIGRGQLEQEIAVPSGDELEELAHEFQAMAAKLAQSQSLLEEKVRRRTAELSRLNAELRQEIKERRQSEAEQQRAEAQVHILSQELLRVQERERQRIALDLHDNVAQELSSLKVLSETLLAEPLLTVDQVRTRLGEWSGHLSHCIGTVRELSYDLRPPGLEQMSLKTVLVNYCRDFTRKNGIQVDFFAAGMDSVHLDYQRAINLYRLLQEGLNNVKEHARVAQARVKLLASFPHIIMRIEDDGQGFDLAEEEQRALVEKRLGLLGMAERVKLLGGRLTLHARPGEGTKIFIEIPWDNTDGADTNSDCR